MIKKILEMLAQMFSVKTPYDEGNETIIGGELPSPRVAIDRRDIHYYPDSARLVVDMILPRVMLATVQASNSMEPLIDIGHIAVLSDNEKYMSHLNFGDIIIWEKGGKKIIHSIVEIGEDSLGWYCRTQGLNRHTNPTPDEEIIRKEDIKWVALCVFWCDSKELSWGVIYE
uniref:Putative peptidase n=1 Tax=viral metagenome TaxID=1070528 RepID=A0A6M3J4A7_9ZZZZ